MKKNILLLGIVLSAVLALGGCKKKAPEQTETIPPLTTEAEAPEETSEAQTGETEAESEEVKTPEYLNRADSKELVFFYGGKETKAQATLYTGSAFSVYVFDEGLEHGTEVIDGFNAETWRVADSKKDVILKVIELKGKNMMEAQEYIKNAFSEFGLIEDKQGGLGGMNKSEEMMEVRFHSSNGQTYAVILTYPASETENRAAVLFAMADTFKS